jgi:hypothetical protein
MRTAEPFDSDRMIAVEGKRVIPQRLAVAVADGTSPAAEGEPDAR